MQQFRGQVQAILFDYGNTLIEFGLAQVEQCDQALSDELNSLFGPHDYEELSRIQHHERRQPYQGEFLENDLEVLTRNLVQRLFDQSPTDEEMERLLEVRFEVMTSCVRVQDEVRELLRRLREHYRIGLISNYPCGRAIRHSLQEQALEELFEVVVVSGDIGRVKPHPSVFQSALDQMQLDPEAVLFVGDNWLGDIQGARRLGMRAVWTQQFVPYEKFDREPGHHEPDAVIDHICALEALCDD